MNKTASDIERRRLKNRIDDSLIDHPFTDYWDIFVLKHQNPYNIALHALGVIIFYGLIALAAITRNPWALLFLPLSQMVGLVGHFLFERSHIDLRDALFSVRASRCLNRMFLRVIAGRYNEDIRRAREALREYQLTRANR
ncbi:MAG: Mpo1-like protein [Acidobacteriota bacterium]